MTESRTAAGRTAAGLLLALLAVCGGGCSGSAARGLSQTRLQAMSYNQRGVEEQAAGNQEAALSEFQEALRLQGSIENVEGMTVALINIARTCRLKGDLPGAQAAIDRGASLLPDSSPLASELFFERAKIALAKGDLPAAKASALRGAASEQGSNLGRRLNLVADILQRQGAGEQALAQADRALKANREAGSVAEEANSLRLLGEIQLAMGAHREALASYHAALLLDKDLGLGRRVAADLRGIGSVTAQKGDAAGAIGFYQRALEVGRNLGDLEFAARDMATLSELYRKVGDAPRAAQIEEARGALLKGGALRGP